MLLLKRKILADSGENTVQFRGNAGARPVQFRPSANKKKEAQSMAAKRKRFHYPPMCEMIQKNIKSVETYIYVTDRHADTREAGRAIYYEGDYEIIKKIKGWCEVSACGQKAAFPYPPGSVVMPRSGYLACFSIVRLKTGISFSLVQQHDGGFYSEGETVTWECGGI